MKITVNRAVLAAAVAQAQRIVERRNTIPILSNVLLRAAGGQLTVVSTDLDMEACISVDAMVDAEGATTVPAVALKDITAKLAGDEITIEVEATRATLRAGRARFSLTTLPEADFPSLSAPDADAPPPWRIQAKTLLKLITQVRFAISTEATRYYLNGIHLHVVDGQLVAVATDGHRLARSQIAVPEGAEAMPGVIVPRKAVAELAALLPPLGSDLVDVSVSSTKLRIKVGATALTTKLIDGTFPDYGRVIPADGQPIGVTLDRQEFAAAVALVSAISSERGRAVKFAFNDTGKLVLTVTNPDTGEATSEMETEHTGGAVEIGFNGSYVQDICAAIEADQMLLQLGDAGSPARICGAGDDASVFVLMPMRV